MKSLLPSTISALIFAATVSCAHALSIVPTFDSSITSDPNASAIETAIGNAIGEMDSYIANPITDDITFSEMSTGLGESSTYYSSVSYTSYLSDLQNTQTRSAADNIAVASLPAGPNNPVDGTANVSLTVPLLRAFGQAGPGFASTISLNTSITNFSRVGLLNPDNYDLETVALHEISETLGAGGAGSGLGGGTVGSLDLFRYSASGVRSYSTANGTTAYFSINGGVTDLRGFNQIAGADYADWASEATPHVQDAFGTPGTYSDLDSVELAALDIVGYNLTPAGMALENVPEPGSLWFVAGGLAAAGVVRWRRRA